MGYGPRKNGPFCSPNKYFIIFSSHNFRPFSPLPKRLSALKSDDGWPRSRVVLTEDIHPKSEKNYFYGGGGPRGPRPRVFVLGVVSGANPN